MAIKETMLIFFNKPRIIQTQSDSLPRKVTLVLHIISHPRKFPCLTSSPARLITDQILIIDMREAKITVRIITGTIISRFCPNVRVKNGTIKVGTAMVVVVARGITTTVEAVTITIRTINITTVITNLNSSSSHHNTTSATTSYHLPSRTIAEAITINKTINMATRDKRLLHTRIITVTTATTTTTVAISKIKDSILTRTTITEAETATSMAITKALIISISLANFQGSPALVVATAITTVLGK